MILITGGAGFIGGNFVLDWLKDPKAEGIVNLDKLSYAGNLATLDSLKSDPRHIFVHGDIGDSELIIKLLKKHQPRAIVNFAAESHVDRSIHAPAEFVQTNIVGTFNLLECARVYWNALDENKKAAFRFHQVSTDEVYGSLSSNDSIY
jgi:dTDP-glucose 4,6-dehydratase